MILNKALGFPERYKSLLVLAVAIVAVLFGSMSFKFRNADSELAHAHGKNEKSKVIEPGNLVAAQNLGSSRIFQGGVFEASGVAYAPGTDGVLFIDDGRANEILWMRLDQKGNQVGLIKPISLGVSIIDPEGITFDGSRFYIVGSQSRTTQEEANSLISFRFDPQSQSVKDVESVSGLYSFLTGGVPELKEYSGKKGGRGSINIEGLAWDPVQDRLLLGMRDPQIGGQALVTALKLRDPKARLSRENLALAQPTAIRLSLGGDAIRSIEYDGSSKAFQIISGAPETRKKGDFKLWEWDGQTSPRQKIVLDSTLKPEGITRVSIGGQNFNFIVCDGNGYFKLN
jgi:hypothetical protein